jgi:endonuclease/exonuclease/phosphatase family metal-dependent hydrolase
VLPWRSSRSRPPWVGAGHAEKTANALDDLLLHLRAAGPLVWGGDWNHALSGREHAGSQGGRRELLRALDELDLVVPTADLPHPVEGLLSIDHVAVPSGTVAAAARVEATREGTRLSDHDAYVVDAEL